MTKTTDNPVSGVAAWASMGIRTVALPSGARVKLRIPDLEAWMMAGDTPDELRLAAMADSGMDPANLTREERLEGTKRQTQLMLTMLAQAILEPSVTVDDLSKIPPQDLGMLMGIATRRIDEDAAGQGLGFAPLRDYATFRDEPGGEDGGAPGESVEAPVPGDQ